jgi:hypothetical protein
MGFWELETLLGHPKELDWHMQDKSMPQMRRGGGIDTSRRIYVNLLPRSDSLGIFEGTTAEGNVKDTEDGKTQKCLSEYRPIRSLDGFGKKGMTRRKSTWLRYNPQPQ